MKKITLILLFVLIGVGIYLSYGLLHPAPIVDVPVKAIETKPQASSFVAERLMIPKIKVDAKVEQVGLDKEKRMDVPKDDMDVGWYKYGAVPGEKGSAVLAGHFDTKKGGPAVFYKLSELQVNDSVIIVGKNGEDRTFVVTDTKIFKDESFPISLVFSQDDTEHLNLITCDGVFDKNEKNYSDRLVVFTKLKK